MASRSKKEQVNERINALLEMARRSTTNENEARDALLKARELCAKYKVDMSKLKGACKPKENIVEIKIKDFYANRTWVVDIANVICENLGVVSIVSTTVVGTGRPKKYIKVVGLEYEANTATEVIKSAIAYVDRKSTNAAQLYADKGLSTAGKKTSWCIGFYLGLSKAYENQTKDNPEWALALTVPVKVTEHVEKLTNGKIANLNRNYKDIDMEELKSGKKAGEEFGTQTCIENKNV